MVRQQYCEKPRAAIWRVKTNPLRIYMVAQKSKLFMIITLQYRATLSTANHLLYFFRTCTPYELAITGGQ